MPYTVAQLAYLAGLIDGEGHITIELSGVKTRPNHQVTACIVNTDHNMILWLRENFGGIIYMQPRGKGVDRTRVRDCYRWVMHTDLQDHVLPQLLPFLITKKSRAEIAIEFRKTIKTEYRKTGLPPEVFQKREELRLAIKAINGAPPPSPIPLPLIAPTRHPQKGRNAKKSGVPVIQNGFSLDQIEG